VSGVVSSRISLRGRPHRIAQGLSRPDQWGDAQIVYKGIASINVKILGVMLSRYCCRPRDITTGYVGKALQLISRIACWPIEALEVL
jgi:hypothetical protein